MLSNTYMSKILSLNEAMSNEIAAKMAASMGFDSIEVRHKETSFLAERVEICNVKIKTYTKGFLWWKRECEKKEYSNILSGETYEEVLLKLENLLSNRVERANELREKYASILLDEELSKDE